MDYLSLGKVTDAFGLDGTLKIYSTTNMGEKRYSKGATVYLFDNENNVYAPYKVLNYRHTGLFDFVKLENIDSIEAALSKKGQEIFVEKNQNDLGKNEYFYSDLRGCKIIDKNGKNLGIVKEIEEFPAQITLRVTRNGKPDFFVPFIEVFIAKIDIENKEITINVMEGLLWSSRF